MREQTPLEGEELFKVKSPHGGFFHITFARVFLTCLYHDKLPHHAGVFMF